MKKYLLILLFLCSVKVSAQDVIVKKDGSTILSKVTEIGISDVKYKKYSNLDGPLYTIRKVDILSVNYENGEKESFDDKQNQTVNDDAPSFVKKEAASDNAEIISKYNRDYYPTEYLKKKSGKAKKYMLIFWASPESIMSNEDVEVTLVRHDYLINFEEGGPLAGIGGGSYEHVNYTLNIRNKTDKTIYVDKGNCFRIENDGTSYCYGSQDQMTIGKGDINGSSISLGGVSGQIAGGFSIGGAKSNSVSTTYSQQRVIAIAPHANRNLTEERIIDLNEKGTKRQVVEKAETFDFELLNSSNIHYWNINISLGEANPPKFKLYSGIVEKGKVLTYDEQDSPYSREYLLTYSTDENFKTYSTISQKWFLREIIGAGKYHWMSGNANWRINNAKYIEGLNRYTIEGYYDAEYW